MFRVVATTILKVFTHQAFSWCTGLKIELVAGVYLLILWKDQGICDLDFVGQQSAKSVCALDVVAFHQHQVLVTGYSVILKTQKFHSLHGVV